MQWLSLQKQHSVSPHNASLGNCSPILRIFRKFAFGLSASSSQPLFSTTFKSRLEEVFSAFAFGDAMQVPFAIPCATMVLPRWRHQSFRVG